MFQRPAVFRDQVEGFALSLARVGAVVGDCVQDHLPAERVEGLHRVAGLLPRPVVQLVAVDAVGDCRVQRQGPCVEERHASVEPRRLDGGVVALDVVVESDVIILCSVLVFVSSLCRRQQHARVICFHVGCCTATDASVEKGGTSSLVVPEVLDDFVELEMGSKFPYSGVDDDRCRTNASRGEGCVELSEGFAIRVGKRVEGEGDADWDVSAGAALEDLGGGALHHRNRKSFCICCSDLRVIHLALVETAVAYAVYRMSYTTTHVPTRCSVCRPKELNITAHVGEERHGMREYPTQEGVAHEKNP